MPRPFSTLEALYAERIGVPLPRDLLSGKPMHWMDQKLFGSEEARGLLYTVQSMITDFLEEAPEGYLTMGFWGHGMNSHAFYHQRVEPGCRVFLRLPHGGIFDDSGEDSRRIREVMDWLPGFLAALRPRVRHLELVDSMGAAWMRLGLPDGRSIEGRWSSLQLATGLPPELEPVLS
ncbi:hypothetical protein [Synechococcus sp. CCY 9618]|uniref:hypothetical protein n=1 Tax=Synechococcus sp. CCY 9618 TaxID=2815602 RepID=UPI001C233781|nr:hypothetical protein [Synechococcus sp. CCY 9618]